MVRLKRYWRIVFPIAIALVIWFFSSRNGDTSQMQSMSVANWLGWSNDVTRKVAHIVLFAAFGISLAFFSSGVYINTYPHYEALFSNLIVVAVYSAIDEIHQLLVAGRNATFSDVVLDFVAGLCGVLIYIALYCLVWKRIQKWFREDRYYKNY